MKRRRIESSSIQETKEIMDHSGLSERNFTRNYLPNQLQELYHREETIKKNLAFWNAMSDGKLETITGAINLFILLLVITLGGSTYNGNTNGSYVLGWLCVSQVSFFYLAVLFVKFRHIPALERDLQQIDTTGFRLYQTINTKKKQINKLGLSQLEILYRVVTKRGSEFNKCFPGTLAESVLKEVNSTLASRSEIPYQPNDLLAAITLKEKNAKWWQQLWQSFILGKSFSVPGVLLLVFIITTDTIATIARTSVSMHNTQGWLAVGSWAIGIATFIFIKVFLWDKLNEEIENAKSSPFLAFYPISIKHKTLKDLTLKQLQEMEIMLARRQHQFQVCFPEYTASNVLKEVKTLISQKLPKRKDQHQQYQLNAIVKEQAALQSYLTAWTSFFNQRLITVIISSLKFLIVMAATFVHNYPQTTKQSQNAKLAVGSMGIICFVFGYLFYVFLKAFYLNYLEKKLHEKRSTPFTTFRLVYFGGRTLDSLQVHQLEDINEALNLRREQFVKCFPKVNTETLDDDVYGLLNEKLDHHTHNNIYRNLIQVQTKARKSLAFWTGYVDGPLMTSMYSIYVLLVHLIITITSLYDGAPAVMGWVGVAVLSLLILIFLFFKFYLLDYMGNSVKALRIDGFSEFNLVYTKSKELSAVQLADLHKIQSIIEDYPIQFRSCFPQASCEATLKEVRELIAEKESLKQRKRVLFGEQQARFQLYQLELVRCKNAFASWNGFIFEKLFVATPIAIVVFILWSLCIATSYYGINVCGFLAVGVLSLIALCLCFHLCYYRPYLEGRIRECELHMKYLEFVEDDHHHHGSSADTHI